MTRQGGAAGRPSRSAALVLLAVLLAGCGSASATPSAVATISPTPVASAALTPPIATPAASALPSPTEASDPGDEPSGSEIPNPAFTPGPSGLPAPTPSLPPARLPGEPDPALTPGALNPAVTQATIGSTICRSGWTDTIRPPVSYTNGLKQRQIGEYGYSDTSMAAYEEDHLVSLELGGDPTDPRNLWPEPYEARLADGREVGAHVKDAFETRLKHEVCAGTLTLAQAQLEIGDHWVHFYLSMP